MFGYTTYVHIHKHQHQRSKLDPCARKCIFIGYANFQKSYRYYDPITNTVHVSLGMSFHKYEPTTKGERGCEGNPSSLVHITEFKDIENLKARFNNLVENLRIDDDLDQSKVLLDQSISTQEA